MTTGMTSNGISSTNTMIKVSIQTTQVQPPSVISTMIQITSDYSSTMTSSFKLHQYHQQQVPQHLRERTLFQ